LPRDTRHRARSAALCASALILALAARPANGAEGLNFPPSDFDILSTETGELIGHGHYTVDQTADSLILRGENRYLNGEYDTEEDKLTIAAGSETPTMTSFRHDFFNPDGSPLARARLDTGTGFALCAKAVAGKPEPAPERLTIPGDTYAGASVLLPIQQLVARGDRGETIKLHVFNCAPTPKVIAVDVNLEPQGQTWVEYPGELEQVDIKPNFGFWTVVIQPFIPKLAAWFDPSQQTLLVGAQLQRFYKGAKIILVRKREASFVRTPSAAEAPPP